MAGNENPPPFEPPKVVSLISSQDSKIINVSIYPARAEITRSFEFEVGTGQNQVLIQGLPKDLYQDSVRVEGRGSATIHDVTISSPPRPSHISPALDALNEKKERIERGIDRCNKSLSALESFLETVNVQHVSPSQIGEVLARYDTEAEKLQDKLDALQKELMAVKENITKEKPCNAIPTFKPELSLQAAIGVFAPNAGTVEIALIYAVASAHWAPAYDIRVDAQKKEKQVTLIYKAGILQSTGEDWNDIELKLETVTPTFGGEIPSLDPWKLSEFTPWRPPALHYRRRSRSRSPQMLISVGSPRRRGRSPERVGVIPYPEDPSIIHAREDRDTLQFRMAAVSSQGNVSATFRVPGRTDVPSDGQVHSVTIAQLELDAVLSWLTVPKQDIKAYLKAMIKNASEYTLLQGIASVYLDGSFISKSDIPAVSPQETFECTLGMDHSARVTYHPRIQKTSQSGLYQKTSNHKYSQRITVYNSKSMAIPLLKIVDQIPISENSNINVKLINPNLTSSLSSTIGRQKGVETLQGVKAQWVGTDEPTNNSADLGKDGKIEWVCSIGPQQTINVQLDWEVTAPVGVRIQGL